MNSNLVISLSDDDDDSGSGYEQHRDKGAPKSTNVMKKPPTLPPLRHGTVPKAATSEGKLSSRKASLDCTFVSPMTKVYGTHSKNLKLLMEQPNDPKSAHLKRRVSGEHNGCGKTANWNDTKLQDLRQKIAIRENELIHKSVQQNAEKANDSFRDLGAMSLKLATRKCGRVCGSADTETEQPQPKRLRVGQKTSAEPSAGSLGKASVKCDSLPNDLFLENNLRGILQNRVVSSSASKPRLEEGRPLLTGESIPTSGRSISLLILGLEFAKDRLYENRRTHLLSVSIGDKSKHLKEVNDSHQLSSTPNFRTILDHSRLNDISRHHNFKSTSEGHLPMHFLEPNVSGASEVDVESFLEIEEFHDKELEQAQEYRRRCEIEERNALRAYRKAHRALAEANARCAHLYRRRESFSAQLRTFMMDDSNILHSSGQQVVIGDRWNVPKNVSETNLDLVPTSSHGRQGEYDAVNEQGYHSNVQSGDDDPQNILSPNVEGQNLGSEACSEPDASTSELVPFKYHNVSPGVFSRSNDQNASADEDNETFPIIREPQADKSVGKDRSREEESEVSGDSNRGNLVDESKDPHALEAYLRSKLFSGLRNRTSSRKCIGGGDSKEVLNGRSVVDGVACFNTRKPCESDTRDNYEIDVGIASVSDVGIAGASGVGREETRTKVVNTRLSAPVECTSSEVQVPAADLEEGEIQLTGDSQLGATMLPSPYVRSVFYQLKFVSQVRSSDLQCSNHICGILSMYRHDDLLKSPHRSKFGNQEHCSEEFANISLLRSVGAYSSNSKVDPFWPLCMYELRGKCNNDECPWQHSKDYSGKDEYESSGSADHQSGSLPSRQREKCPGELSSLFSPPTYLVVVDFLKPYCAFGSIPIQNVASCWRKVFSATLAISSSFQKHVASDEPILHGNDGCVKSRGLTSRNSLYYWSRCHKKNIFQNGLVDNYEILEIALLALHQETNEPEGVKKSLALLSRVLESDPALACVWIVYLSIYYNDSVSIREDDLFSYAVKHNKLSYELWLMYINSRLLLTEKVAAYEEALSNLCSFSPSIDFDVVHASACILDIFLQMLHCLCITGNVGEAIQKYFGLGHTQEGCDDSCSPLFSDILPYLIFSDKCIFWVCSMYLVVYRELPVQVVQQFEFKKEIPLIDWPPPHIPIDDKQQAYRLMELAVESVKLHQTSLPLEDETVRRSAHLFALNHVLFVGILGCIESYMNLLDQYARMYPSSLELVLLSARAQDCESESPSFVGFREALNSWPKEIPGIQCLWNQYAEHALHYGRLDAAKEIMSLWFDFVSKIRSSGNTSANEQNLEGCMENVSLTLCPEEQVPYSSGKDRLFALLNHSLHMVMGNDMVKAGSTMDKAWRAASPDEFRHSVREHAVFISNYGTQSGSDALASGLMKVLSGYVAHAKGLSISEPLTRNFMQNVKKPRTRQLITNLLHPISADFSVVNMVLEIWFGPSLLPKKFDRFKYLVDFVEAILEISPANYPVAISVSKKLLDRDCGISDMCSASFSFWASSLLTNTIYQCIPVAPESVWVEAIELLGSLTNTSAVSVSFHRRALSAYPFSLKLWKSFQNLCISAGSSDKVVQAARVYGIEL